MGGPGALGDQERVGLVRRAGTGEELGGDRASDRREIFCVPCRTFGGFETREVSDGLSTSVAGVWFYFCLCVIGSTYCWV